jgi:hypothetical protein
MGSPPVLSGVRVTRSLVLCVCFVDRCLSFCTFSFRHCVVCSSSIYGFWLPIWYLQTLLTIFHPFTVFFSPLSTVSIQALVSINVSLLSTLIQCNYVDRYVGCTFPLTTVHILEYILLSYFPYSNTISPQYFLELQYKLKLMKEWYAVSFPTLVEWCTISLNTFSCLETFPHILGMCSLKQLLNLSLALNLIFPSKLKIKC